MELDWNIQADSSTRELLNSLKGSSIAEYRCALSTLGTKLSDILVKQITKSDLLEHDICVACNAVDADYLARRVLERLDQLLPAKSMLACFWNQHSFTTTGLQELKFAPIVKQYREPVRADKCIVAFVDSFFADEAAIATDISNLISDLNPKLIYLLSPFMFSGFEARLQAHLPTVISKKLCYIRFATVPTESSFRRMLDEAQAKEMQGSAFVPAIVRSRREQFIPLAKSHQ